MRSGGLRHITMPNFLKTGLCKGEILWFFDFPSGRHHLGFFNLAKFYWLVGWRGSRCISMPNFIKIGQSFAKISRFFDFSKWRPSAILDLFGTYFDHPQWVLMGLYHSAKFGYDWCSSFYNMNISIFDVFGWRMPIHAPKIGFFGQFDPINGLQYQPKPKEAHPCVSLCHLSH